MHYKRRPETDDRGGQQAGTSVEDLAAEKIDGG
jgi:hypothetical protein